MLRRFLQTTDRRELLLRLIVILGIAGMGCILLSSFLPAKTETAEIPQETSGADDYRTQLESDLTAMLSAMEGVGRVQVLVTLEGGEEYCYAKSGDRTVSGSQTKSSVSYVTVGGSREALLESVAHPAITGVVIACSGGGSPAVQEAVNRAAAVACGLPSNRIYVTKLADTKGETP